MKVAFGTVVRGAPINRGGELGLLDWETGRIERRIPIVPRDPDLGHDANPRGNSRGCRGIAVVDGQLVAANYHTLQFFGPDLREARRLSHGLMAGLHEIWSPGDGTLWVTSTAIDAALRYDLASGDLLEARWPCEHPELRKHLGLEPLALDTTADNRQTFLNQSGTQLHLNAVAGWRGRLVGLFNRRGCIADLDSGRVLIEQEHLRGAHNLVALPNGTVLVNDTSRKAVRCYDLDARREVRALHLLDYPEVARHWRIGRWQILWRGVLSTIVPGVRRPPAMALMVRGLAYHKGHVLIGVSPAAIVRLDWETGKLVGFRRISRSVGECIHGLAVVEDQ
jgi:hypothetical protein